MSIMIVPSLEGKKFLLLKNVSQDEALKLGNWFENDVLANRKVRFLSPKGDVPSIDFYSNLIDKEELHEEFDFDDFNEDIAVAVFDLLAVSETPTVRGARIVYIDPDKNVIGVGSTVVYNENRATIGFQDDAVMDMITDDLFYTLENQGSSNINFVV